MAEVLTYGNPALRTKSAPVARVDDDVRTLAKEMLTTMYRSGGVGLAAEQIGRTEAMIVIDTSQAAQDAPGVDPENPSVPMPVVMVNPEIEAKRGEQEGPEGCLSFPDILIDIKRAAEVTVAYTDIDNVRHTVDVNGLLARAVQHEIDHLNGVLLLDRMSPLQRIGCAGKLKRLKKQGMAEANG